MPPIELTEYTEKRLREKVDSGTYSSAEDVVQAGLELLDEGEELAAAIAEAEEQFARGEIVTESESRARTQKLLAELQKKA